MDYREENIFTAQGCVSVILDWSNALIAPFELELARIEVTNERLLFKKYIESYPNDKSFQSESYYLIYKVYTSSMLSILFKNMLYDAVKGEYFLNMTKRMIRKLSSA